MKIIEDRLRADNQLPSDFCFFRWKWLKSGTEYGVLQLDGGRCPLMQRGPRRGKPNFRKAFERRSFYVTAAQIAKYDSDFERETSMCSECRGSGQKASRVSVEDGTEYTVCRKCRGTGTPNRKTRTH